MRDSGKSFLVSVLLLVGFQTRAANWYVDPAATGAVNGTSWADAWTSFSAIVWGASGVNSNDTLYISGGPSGRVYTNQLNTGASGIPGAPITISPGRDAGHNGLVTISNKVTLAGSWITLDGSKDPSASWNTNWPFTTNNLLSFLETNINLRISNPSNHGVLHQGLHGAWVKWVRSDNCGIADTAVKLHGFTHYYSAPAGSIVTNSGFTYCLSVSNAYDGFNFTANNATNWNSMEISYSAALYNADDNMQLSDGTTVHHCWIEGKRGDIAVGHPDAVQAVGDYFHFHHNWLEGKKNSWIYFEFGYGSPTDNGHWWVHNNFFYCRGTWENSGYGVYFGTQMDSTTNQLDFVMPAKDGGTVNAQINTSWMTAGIPILFYSESGETAKSKQFGVFEIVSVNGANSVTLRNLETSGGAYSENIEPGETVPMVWVSTNNAGTVVATNRVSGTFVLDSRDIPDVKIVNNTFANAYQSCVQFYASSNHVRNVGFTNVLIANNVAYDGAVSSGNNTFALNASNFPFSYDTNDVKFLTNVVSGRSRGVRWGSSNYADPAALQTATGFTGSVTNVPAFVDSAAWDFRPSTNDTVALGKGANLSSLGITGIDVDLLGVQRGSTWSIGAFDSASVGSGGSSGSSISIRANTMRVGRIVKATP